MKYQDEDEEEASNEIEYLNKVIENNLKLEIDINNNIIDSENLIKKKDWKKLGEYSYHFKQSIEGIWETIKSLNSFFDLNNSGLYPIVVKTDSNIWNKDNIFEGKLFDLYEFIAKVIKLKIFEELKEIEWIVYLGNKNNLRLKLNLYKVTEDNTSVLSTRIKYISSFEEDLIIKIKKRFNENNYIENIEKIFEKESSNFCQYESGIIMGKMEEIWDILIDYSKLSTIAPNNKIFLPININNLKVGDTTKIPMTFKNVDEMIEVKLDIKEDKLGWIQWSFGYSIISSQPYEVLKQSIVIQLTKINSNETQLSITTKINENKNISKKIIKQLSKKKKYVISSIQDYFENF